MSSCAYKRSRESESQQGLLSPTKKLLLKHLASSPAFNSTTSCHHATSPRQTICIIYAYLCGIRDAVLHINKTEHLMWICPNLLILFDIIVSCLCWSAAGSWNLHSQSVCVCVCVCVCVTGREMWRQWGGILLKRRAARHSLSRMKSLLSCSSVPSAVHAAGFMAAVHSVSPAALWCFYRGGQVWEGAVMRNVPKQVSDRGMERLQKWRSWK